MKHFIKYTFVMLLLANPVLSKNLPIQNSKARVRMNLDYYKTPQEEYLNVKITGRLDKRYEPVEGIGVSFYLGSPSQENLLGKVTTNTEGTIRFLLPEIYYEWSRELQELDFFAVLESTSTYQDATEELSIRKVNISLENIDQDSIKTVKANIAEKDSLGSIIPKERVIVKFYIERHMYKSKFNYD